MGRKWERISERRRKVGRMTDWMLARIEKAVEELREEKRARGRHSRRATRRIS